MIPPGNRIDSLVQCGGPEKNIKTYWKLNSIETFRKIKNGDNIYTRSFFLFLYICVENGKLVYMSA